MEEIKYTRRKIKRVSKDGVVEFASVIEASNAMILDSKHIYKALARGTSTRGYTFEWAEDLLPGEVWVFHPNGRAVSNMGRSKSKTRGPTFGCHRPNGYMVIYDGSRMYQVHRMVLEAFSSVEEGLGKHCDHIDGNKTNNKLVNLRWTTPAQNAMNRRKRQKFKHCETCSCKL